MGNSVLWHKRVKKTMTDWLEAEKITADALLERLEVQFSQGKPFNIN
jgi:hypothetical protein